MTNPETDTRPTTPEATILVVLTDSLSTRLVRGQLGYLVAEGFDVHLATAATPGRSQPTAADWERLCADLDPGVTPHHIPFVREPSPWSDVRAAWRAVALIRSIRPDLISCSTPKAGLLGMLVAWLCRVPVRVYIVRGLRFETLTGRRRRFYEFTEKLAMRLAHHVVFNSESLRRVVETQGLMKESQGHVVGSGSGNGVDTQKYSSEHLPSGPAARKQLGLDPDALVVGFVGRLTADKGVDDLVRIFVEDLPSSPRLSHVSDRLWLVLVGDQEPGDPLDPRTTLLVAEHPRIIQVGWVDDPRTVYPAFNVLAFPSYREGLPNVPLEAQLCSVPVVGYAATGTVDAVRHLETGLLVPVGDRRGLADALAEVLVDRDLQGRLAVNGRQWVATTFDRQRIWSELVDLYRKWLDQAR